MIERREVEIKKFETIKVFEWRHSVFPVGV